MDEITIRQAWLAWLDGTNINDMRLWGLEILWWGRFGKIAELVAALAIIAEIVGPDRLNALAIRLHVALDFSQSWAAIRTPWCRNPSS